MSDERDRPITVSDIFSGWDIPAAFDALDRSLSPRPHESVVETLVPLGLDAGVRVLDIGGREAKYALLIAERFGCEVIMVDAVPSNVDRANEAAAAHPAGHSVTARVGLIEQIPLDDRSVQLVFARDVLGHVADLDRALSECRRVLEPGGHMVVPEVFGTEHLHPDEQQQLCDGTATYPERFSVADFESSVARTGFTIVEMEIIGSEHAEEAQESGAAPNFLLHISRLRRERDAFVAELGEIPYRVMYSNALWTIYRMIGKLENRVYVLKRDGVAPAR